MGKVEQIISFLKKNKSEWFTCKEIAEGIDYSVIAVKDAMKRLKEGGEVDFQRTSERGNPIRYAFKK